MRTPFTIIVTPLANGFTLAGESYYRGPGSDGAGAPKPPMPIHVKDEQELRHEIPNMAMSMIGHMKEYDIWEKAKLEEAKEA